MFDKRKKLMYKINYEKVFFVSINLYNVLYKFISLVMISDKNINLFVKSNKILNVINFLKLYCFTFCSQLLDLIVVDKLELVSKSSFRFEIIYVLNSIIYNLRLFVRIFVYPFSFVMSMTKLFNSVN